MYAVARGQVRTKKHAAMPRGRATNSAMTITTTANVDGTKVIVAGPKTNTSGAKIAHAEIRLLVPRRQKHAKRRGVCNALQN